MLNVKVLRKDATWWPFDSCHAIDHEQNQFTTTNTYEKRWQPDDCAPKYNTTPKYKCLRAPSILACYAASERLQTHNVVMIHGLSELEASIYDCFLRQLALIFQRDRLADCGLRKHLLRHNTGCVSYNDWARLFFARDP